MANKDGVALGRTRFNLRGKDLNRDWGNAFWSQMYQNFEQINIPNQQHASIALTA